MSKASILRQLGDDDLEAVNHLIRRDARTDLEIARMAEKHLKRSLGDDAAAAMVIARYRASQSYQAWLKQWEGRDAELRKAIETQKQRFEFVSKLVSTDSGGGASAYGEKTGLEAVSNGLMARLLTLATEMSDEELVEAAAGQHGWVAKVIRVVQEQGKAERNKTGERAIEVSQDKKLSPAERELRLKEIFGIA